MFNQSDIRSTLEIDLNEVAAFLSERPTIPVSYAAVSELLLWDVLSDLETEDFEVVQ